ncbi:MAG: SRPBCC family protein [Chloroflexi bacterium]|nr:SRPBCC family protein [Chloroflexota bacterium]
MEFDFESYLSALERSVSYLERDGKSANAVTLARSIATTPADLWDAVTNKERIPRWFSGISGDLELGGKFQIEGNASCTITACEPQAHFALTWEFAGDVSWVEVRLTETGIGSVQLSLTHTALLSPFWDQYGPGAVGVGWETAFLGLTLLLEQPGWTKPDEMEFATSAAGKAFISGSSEGWAQASIAAGTDTEKAHAAARNTTAFYTGAEASPS